MTEEFPLFWATPFERSSRFPAPTSSHRCSVSVMCTRVLSNLIFSAKAVRLRREQAQRLCKVISENPTTLHLLVPAADYETIARRLTSLAASCPTTSTTASLFKVVVLHTVQP
ncbi:hypothetical protein MRX96_008178 [Rhipicephalus microplus]